jgi:hypothetical protein
MMSQFDLTTPIGALRQVGDDVTREWNETIRVWNDANSREIEQNHLQPFLLELRDAINAMQRLAELVQQARRECLPDQE